MTGARSTAAAMSWCAHHPPARYFTLTLYTPPDNWCEFARRRGFTSQELVRDAPGEFEITVSPRRGRQLAADRRHRQLYPHVALLRYVAWHCDAGRPRSPDAGDPIDADLPMIRCCYGSRAG